MSFTLTIPANATSGQFYLTPVTSGDRNITITTSPVLIYKDSPIVYNSESSVSISAGDVISDSVASGIDILSTTSLWANTIVPTGSSNYDPNPVSLGLQFFSDIAGYITGAKYYRGAHDTQAHMAQLWASKGHVLASENIPAYGHIGWQKVNFPTPVAITAGTIYVISYHVGDKYYVVNENYFTSEYSNGTLHAPINAGVYKYGSISAFPNQSWNASNYWIDIIFSTTK